MLRLSSMPYVRCGYRQALGLTILDKAMRLPNSILRPKLTVLLDDRLSHSEIHMAHRVCWLRPQCLAQMTRIVSTASLVVGVARQGPGAALVPVSPGWWLARCRWWRVFR